MSYQKIEKQALAERSHETALIATNKNVPKLKNGNDEKRAKQLDKLIKDAESGLRRILTVGFFLECLADELPRGQLGPWVEAHCNRQWRTVRRWKQVATGVADVLGISMKQRLEYKLHEVLALPLKKVPSELKDVREKIEAEIAGKSYRQLFLELKQVDEDDPSKPKRGQRKGSKGLTKEAREAAAQREEQERLNELEEATLDSTTWLLETADALGVEGLEEKLLIKHREACLTKAGVIERLLAARKSGGAK